ncbi:ribosome maturation factor RimM [Campylobacter sp. US33a]|uniref:Ribosome maturation factor RimM n=1 Tax=Campylobacter sp. CCS1377 TaxID=3158229 RepID=A0AAU7E3W8_9BACT|nr:ribosome maturation factor RimM [Campylobacter sp. US33a]TEY01553.1 16S rRNA processing protein RimM [Campylobacter sp. US33a]
MNKNETSLVQVAKLGKTSGLKGFVKLHSVSDFIEQFKKGAEFFDHRRNIYKIKNTDLKNSLVLFENYESIELAKKLTNLTLFQSIENTRKTCKLKKDEYFYFDILDCDIIEDEKKLGKVIDILEIGKGYLFCIQTDEKLENLSHEFYIPYNDYYVKNIDINCKCIYTQNAFLILENS